jgi:hypothetical protein
MKRRGRLWRCNISYSRSERRYFVLVTPFNGTFPRTYSTDRAVVIRALTGRAAGRRYIRGNLHHVVACGPDWECGNPFGGDTVAGLMANKLTRRMLLEDVRRQFGRYPNVVVLKG